VAVFAKRIVFIVLDGEMSIAFQDGEAELKAGDHVRHAQFGDGVVVSCQPVKDDTEVIIAFDGAGIKRLLLSFARLEKVG